MRKLVYRQACMQIITKWTGAHADALRYGSRHSLADQGDFGAAGESGPLVVPAGAGLMLAAEH